MRRFVLVAAVIAFTTIPAYAQPTSQATGYRLDLQPTEIETITFRFHSWTLTAAGTCSVALRGIPAQADATPSGIITAGPTLSGSTDLSVTITGTSARAGNCVQLSCSPTGTNVTPKGDLLVCFNEVFLVP